MLMQTLLDYGINNTRPCMNVFYLAQDTLSPIATALTTGPVSFKQKLP